MKLDEKLKLQLNVYHKDLKIIAPQEFDESISLEDVIDFLRDDTTEATSITIYCSKKDGDSK